MDATELDEIKWLSLFFFFFIIIIFPYPFNLPALQLIFEQIVVLIPFISLRWGMNSMNDVTQTKAIFKQLIKLSHHACFSGFIYIMRKIVVLFEMSICMPELMTLTRETNSNRSDIEIDREKEMLNPKILTPFNGRAP